ncbi:MAG: hypothetical protein Q8M76_13780 [Spirochaetaceae bacterium]|nr:hypothetical protein [Spirochaetaceae bacterium]
MKRALACLAAIGLISAAGDLVAQGIPEALLAGSLAIRFHAYVPRPRSEAVGAEAVGASSPYSWEQEDTKFTIPGTAVSLKLVFDNGVVLISATPFESGPQRATLVAQGQIWMRAAGGFSYRTTIETVSVEYGEPVLYFPFGVDTHGGSPLRIELAVLRPAAPPLPDSPKSEYKSRR